MPEYIEAAPLDRILSGTATTVTIGGKDIALFNVNGTVYATNDRCLHAGGSLGFAGKLDGKIVTCRLHGWRFDVTTGDMPIAPGMNLGCYLVKIENGKVYVAV